VSKKLLVPDKCDIRLRHARISGHQAVIKSSEHNTCGSRTCKLAKLTKKPNDHTDP
jgi:hypothetical protein